MRLPLTERLERSFAARASDFPAQTRALLLAGAANDTESLREALNAASVVSATEVTISDLSPAVDARLVEVHDARLRFRHPLMRSAIIQAASVSDLRAAHAALASGLGAQPDRHVWHLSASTVGADETVAAQLDDLASRAQRRGAAATAAAALERAAQLSEDENAQAIRLLRSGELAFQLGRHDDVQRLLKAAEPLARGHEDVGRIALIREMTEAGRPRDAVRLRSTVDSAEQLYSLGHRQWLSICFGLQPPLATGPIQTFKRAKSCCQRSTGCSFPTMTRGALSSWRQPGPSSTAPQ